MAGYHGYSMSNNAVAAYSDGARPLSKIDTTWLRENGIEVSAATLKDLVSEGVVTTREYHHTGKMYNSTDFYRPEDLREQIEALTSEEIAEARAAAKAARQKAKEAVVHHDCLVEWLEWGGTRERPRAFEEQAWRATVSVRANTATITCRGGGSFRKRLDTRGFSFTTPEQMDAEQKARLDQELQAEAKEWLAEEERYRELGDRYAAVTRRRDAARRKRAIALAASKSPSAAPGDSVPPHNAKGHAARFAAADTAAVVAAVSAAGDRPEPKLRLEARTALLKNGFEACCADSFAARIVNQVKKEKDD